MREPKKKHWAPILISRRPVRERVWRRGKPPRECQHRIRALVHVVERKGALTVDASVALADFETFLLEDLRRWEAEKR